MAEAKTKPTTASVPKFLSALEDEQVRADCRAIAEIMEAATKAKPVMWGENIVGFGACRFVYAGGREADWPVIAFSPRKQNISLYVMGDFAQREELLASLGKHSSGKACLYIKRLSDIHLPTLKKLVRESVKHMLKTHAH